MSAFKLFAVANLCYELNWIILNYPIILSHQCITAVSLETYPLYSLIFSYKWIKGGASKETVELNQWGHWEKLVTWP